MNVTTVGEGGTDLIGSRVRVQDLVTLELDPRAT